MKVDAEIKRRDSRMVLAMVVCCGMIVLLLFGNAVMMDDLEQEKERERIRHSEKEVKYKAKIDQLEQDVAIRDEIIRAYRDGGFRSEKD